MSSRSLALGAFEVLALVHEQPVDALLLDSGVVWRAPAPCCTAAVMSGGVEACLPH